MLLAVACAATGWSGSVRDGVGGEREFVDAVAVVEQEVRELVRRRGLDPAGDSGAVRTLVDDVISDYDDRTLGGALPRWLSQARRPSHAAVEPTTPSVPAFPKAAAQQAARSALLTVNDFAAGWSTSPSNDDSSDDAKVDQQMATCLHAPSSVLGSSVPTVPKRTLRTSTRQTAATPAPQRVSPFTTEVGGGSA